MRSTSVARWVTSRPLAVRDKGSVRKRSGRQMRHAPSERIVGHRKRASKRKAFVRYCYNKIDMSSKRSLRDNKFKVSAAASVGASVLCTEVSTGHPHPVPATKMKHSPFGGCFVFITEIDFEFSVSGFCYAIF